MYKKSFQLNRKFFLLKILYSNLILIEFYSLIFKKKRALQEIHLLQYFVGFSLEFCYGPHMRYKIFS